MPLPLKRPSAGTRPQVADGKKSKFCADKPRIQLHPYLHSPRFHSSPLPCSFPASSSPARDCSWLWKGRLRGHRCRGLEEGDHIAQDVPHTQHCLRAAIALDDVNPMDPLLNQRADDVAQGVVGGQADRGAAVPELQVLIHREAGAGDEIHVKVDILQVRDADVAPQGPILIDHSQSTELLLHHRPECLHHFVSSLHAPHGGGDARQGGNLHPGNMRGQLRELGLQELHNRGLRQNPIQSAVGLHNGKSVNAVRGHYNHGVQQGGVPLGGHPVVAVRKVSEVPNLMPPGNAQEAGDSFDDDILLELLVEEDQEVGQVHEGAEPAQLRANHRCRKNAVVHELLQGSVQVPVPPQSN
eukprot:RCo005103